MNAYAEIAKSLKLPTGALIDGKFVAATSGATFETRNPYTGELIATLPACGVTDVDLAVAAARRSFDEGVWSDLHPSERKVILGKLADLVMANVEELAVMEALDAGKPVTDCMELDLPETANAIRWHGEAQDKLHDQIAPTGSDALALVVREPVGVVAAVLPWNFPLLMMAWKIGPALATGNSVIVKPAEQTSLTALRLAELALDAGVPPGVLNVVTGMGPDAGVPLGRHMDVDALTFTGSTEVGRKFLKYSAQSNLKEVCLEMGGKSAAVVLSDDEDIAEIAATQASAIFWNMGENCTADSRIIAHKDVYDALVAEMAKQVAGWPLGDPLDPATRQGSLISEEHFAKVSGLVDSGKAQGARELKAGTLGVNTYSEGDISTPFCGFKASGFGGRDNGIHAHEQYTELKTIWIDLSE